MFKDYPHKNNFLKDSNVVIKSLSDKEVLHKEFAVLDFLQKYNFVPRVYNFDGNSFYEERITGREMQVIDLSYDSIKRLSLILKKLHTLEMTPELIKVLGNDFIKESNYQPELVLEAILIKAPKDLDIYKDKLYKIANDIADSLSHKKYKLSLIHGDLSFHNIFLSDKAMFLIDWTDCRLDISSCDVSQLFYLLNFNKEQENIFLKYYDSEYIDDRLLIFHKILLFLYDSVDFYFENKRIDNELFSKLSKLIDKFYEQ